MMKRRSHWNRREFVRIASASLGAMNLNPAAFFHAPQRITGIAPRFAYVGFGGEGTGSEGIAAFDVRGGQWKQTSTVVSRRPSWLTIDRSQQFLYAVNSVDEHEGLPSGTVEAYAIDTADGSLKLLNRQMLSLSATSPRHAAISPDGKALVVAVHGGGGYNVLPLKNDGSLGPVSGILKETGSGPHHQQTTAHPQMIVFDPKGRALSADLGNDRLSILNLDAMQLAFAARYQAQAGEGPRRIAFHPDGRLLFVANGLHASVACYAYDADEGIIIEKLNQVSTSRNEIAGGVVMAIDSAGEYLYTAHPHTNDGVCVWMIERNTAKLRRLQVVEDGIPRLHEMTMTPDGKGLLALSREDQAVLLWPIANGQLGRGMRLTHIPAPLSVAMKSL
jgi:6-phosphogluconolactonase